MRETSAEKINGWRELLQERFWITAIESAPVAKSILNLSVERPDYASELHCLAVPLPMPGVRSQRDSPGYPFGYALS